MFDKLYNVVCCNVLQYSIQTKIKDLHAIGAKMLADSGSMIHTVGRIPRLVSVKRFGTSKLVGGAQARWDHAAGILEDVDSQLSLKREDLMREGNKLNRKGGIGP
jgi:hypothetical protein